MESPCLDVRAGRIPNMNGPSRRNIEKNIGLISLSFLCLFTTYNGLERLQSSLNVESGLGVVTNAVIYTSVLISSLILPSIVIKMLGHKWTMAVCNIPYLLYIPANGYAHWGTMMPAGALVGVAAGPLWTAVSSYFTLLAGDYARATGRDKDTVIAQFFGVQSFAMQVGNIITAVITATVLQVQPSNSSVYSRFGANISRYCGGNDCPRDGIGQTMIKSPEQSVMLLATVSHMRNRLQLLIIPLMVYCGLTKALFAADFNKSFVSCLYGIWNVGWVALPFAVSNCLTSASSGFLVKCFGRPSVFTSGLAIDLAIQMTLLFWYPTAEERFVAFVLSALWGVADAIGNTQLFGLTGVLFSDNTEAAFANISLWRSTGMIIGFAFSPVLCTSSKIYIATGTCIVATAGYHTAEYIQYKKNKQTSRSINGGPIVDIEVDAFLNDKKKDPSTPIDRGPIVDLEVDAFLADKKKGPFSGDTEGDALSDQDKTNPMEGNEYS